MSQVKTNNVGLAYTRESSLGVPGTLWKSLEPNTITTFGATLDSVSRSPISQDRQRRKGSVTDLNSPVEFEADVTWDCLMDFFESFLYSQFNDPGSFGPLNAIDVTAVTATGYTISPALGVALANNVLIYARGFTTAANNGLKVLAGTPTTTEIKTTGLVVEAAPPAMAQVEVCGYQGSSADLRIDGSGNLTSEAAGVDFTTLGLTAGQAVWIGGETAGTSFATTAYRGYARITVIAAHKLTLDKRAWTVGAADTGTGKTIQIFYGKFGRNVTVSDADYVERSFTFEGAYTDLYAVSTPGYEYSKGNLSDSVEFNIPLAGKATVTFGFQGTVCDAPTSSRLTGASTALAPLATTAFNTSSDVARLRTGSMADPTVVYSSYFKSLKLTIKNNVSPEKVVGTLGAAFMNVGNLEVDITAQVLFTSEKVPAAIRNNETVTLDFTLRNSDGAMYVDLPELTLGGGGKDFPVNETVLLNVTGMAHKNAAYGTSLNVSLFPYAPAA